MMEMESSIHQEEKIKDHLERYTGNEFSHLIFLHDKYVFWNKNQYGSVFLSDVCG